MRWTSRPLRITVLLLVGFIPALSLSAGAAGIAKLDRALQEMARDGDPTDTVRVIIRTKKSLRNTIAAALESHGNQILDDDQPSPEIEKMLWAYPCGQPLDPNVLRRITPRPSSPDGEA